MLTDTYIKKINPFIKFYKFVYRFRALIITFFILLGISIAALLSIKGFVYNDLVANDITYGQELQLSAKSILSDTSFEFRKVGEETWTKTSPTNAGEYQVRAVGKNIFGMNYNGPIHTFKIKPKAVKPVLQDYSYEYGENPIFTLDLLEGDRLVHQGYHYKSLGTEPSYAFEEGDFLIVDEEGRDITYNYAIDLSDIRANLTPRELVLSLNIEKEYDSTPINSNESPLIVAGSLYNDDYFSSSLNQPAYQVGSYEPSLNINFYSNDFGNINNLYEYTLSDDSNYKINARKITIDTESYEKTYDGIATNLEGVTVSNGSLVPGDRIIAIFNQYIDAGTYDNVPYSIRIYNQQDQDVTRNYDISYNYGKITINPAELEITTGTDTFTYNGDNQSNFDFSITKGKLIEGDNIIIEYINSIEMIHAGTYDNRFNFDIVNESGESKKNNYNITEIYGKVTVNKAKITISTPDVDLVYSGNDYNYSQTYEILEGALALGDTITIVNGVNNFINYEAGQSYENSLEVKIYHDGNLEDERTSDYDITYSYGKINLLKRPLTIATQSDTFFYQEGSTFYNNKFNILEGTLVDNQELNGINYTTISQIGTIENVVTPQILDEFGNDVTSNYEITIADYGTLTVKEDENIIPPGGDEDDTDIPDIDIPQNDEEYEIDVSLSNPGNSPSTPGGEDTENPDTEEPENPDTEEPDIPDVEEPDNPDVEEPEIPGTEEPENPDTEEPIDPNLLFTYKTNGTKPIYLRQNVYGNYREGKLYPGKQYKYGDTNYFNPNLYVGNLLKDSKKTNYLDIEIYGKFTNGFMPYYLESFDYYSSGDFTFNIESYPNLNYSYYDYNFLNEGLNPANLSYIFQFNQNYLNYETFVRNNYLSLTDDLRNLINSYNSRFNLTKENEFDTIYSVGRFLDKYYAYDTSIAYEDSTDIIYKFLDEAKGGKDIHFATAGAMLLRGLGIPARVASGYLINNGSITNENDTYEVLKGTNDFVWTEVYSKDLKAWVNVDFSPIHAIDYTPDPSLPEDFEPSVPGENEGGSTTNPDEPDTEEPDKEDPNNPSQGGSTGGGNDGTGGSGETDVPEEEFPRDEITDDIIISTPSAKFTYDGELHYKHEYEITSGTLLSYDKIEVKYLSAIQNYGKVVNRISYKIIDTRNNKDVTDEYDSHIKFDYGILTVSKTTLNVKSKDKSKAYDGTPLSLDASDLEYDLNELKNNDYISEVSFMVLLTERGNSINLFRINKISKANNPDSNVIGNYEINYTFGILTVY